MFGMPDLTGYTCPQHGHFISPSWTRVSIRIVCNLCRISSSFSSSALNSSGFSAGSFSSPSFITSVYFISILSNFSFPPPNHHHQYHHHHHHHHHHHQTYFKWICNSVFLYCLTLSTVWHRASHSILGSMFMRNCGLYVTSVHSTCAFSKISGYASGLEVQFLAAQHKRLWVNSFTIYLILYTLYG